MKTLKALKDFLLLIAIGFTFDIARKCLSDEASAELIKQIKPLI